MQPLLGDASVDRQSAQSGKVPGDRMDARNDQISGGFEPLPFSILGLVFAQRRLGYDTEMLDCTS